MEQSNLKKLPAELRNQIYEHALLTSEDVNLFLVPGLLQTCHQIRSESLSIFYTGNKFKVVDELTDLPALAMKLNAIGASSAQRVNKLRLDLDVGCTWHYSHWQRSRQWAGLAQRLLQSGVGDTAVRWTAEVRVLAPPRLGPNAPPTRDSRDEVMSGFLFQDMKLIVERCEAKLGRGPSWRNELGLAWDSCLQWLKAALWIAVAVACVAWFIAPEFLARWRGGASLTRAGAWSVAAAVIMHTYTPVAVAVEEL